MRVDPVASDLDLVLITGAGASTKFGLGVPGETSGADLPMMAQWCNVLVGGLKAGVGRIYSDLTGLEQDMTGEEFEQTLGRFLRRVDAFREIYPLLEPSRKVPRIPGPIHDQDVLTEWHKATSNALDETVKRIHESLFEQFGFPRINRDGAEAAYSALLNVLDIGPEQTLVYATTNYDEIGERALQALGRLPDDGRAPQIGTAQSSECRLVMANLVAGLPRYTPVLHLHGKAGWYRRTDPNLTEAGRGDFAIDGTQYSEESGTPIIMLPDPEKSYDAHDAISTLWGEFLKALGFAKRVLVLGHSLNDKQLVQALHDHCQGERVAVAVLADESGEMAASTKQIQDKVYSELPSACLVPVRFAPEPFFGEFPERWQALK